MHITLLKKSNRQGIRKLHLSGTQVICILFLVFSLPFAGVWLGYQWAQPSENETLANKAIADMRDTLILQDQQLEQSKRDAQLQVNALTAKVGLLQAELNRINALGQRVAELAKVKEGEFDFSAKPGIGGVLVPLEDDIQTYRAEDLFRGLDDFEALINDRAYQLDLLESILLDKELSAEVRISGRPITKGWTSSFFGQRADPFTGEPSWHEGMDFAGKQGSDVISTGSGVVVWSGKRYGYGQMIEINHGDGYSTRYAHCEELLVNVGAVVNKGDVIAKMGSQGRSTGPHVHYEVLRHGKPVDPKRYVNRR